MKYKREVEHPKGPADQPRRELLVDLFLLVALPLSTLVAVLFGTQAGRHPHTYAVTNWMALPLFVLLVRAGLAWYSRGRSRAGRWQSAKMMVWAIAAVSLIIMLSLPKLPLSGRWHAHDPAVNISVLILIEFPLSIAICWNLARNWLAANRDAETRQLPLWKKFF